MSLFSSLRSWFRRSRLGGRGTRSSLKVESLEERQVPDAAGLTAGIGAVLPNSDGWFLRNQISAGAPEIAPFAYGGTGWTPLGGDWDGDGTASIATFDPATATWYLKN